MANGTNCGAQIFRYYGNVLSMTQSTQTSDGYLSKEDWARFNSNRGDQGVEGERGTLWYTGIADPIAGSPAGAQSHDIYLNTVTGDLFQYV
jgi:hypothetical protein